MTRKRLSASWLSTSMANALAATGAPLSEEDVSHAADELGSGAEPARVIGHLLARGSNLMHARQIVEALKALHDLAA